MSDRSAQRSNEDGKNRQRTSLALRPEIVTGCEGNGGCGVAYTVGVRAWLVGVGQIHGQGYGVYGNVYFGKTRSVCTSYPVDSLAVERDLYR